MTHSFEIDHALESSPADALAALADPDRWRRLEPTSTVRSRTESSGQVFVDAQSPLPPGSVPPAARSVLPASPTLVQKYALTPGGNGFEGNLDAHVPGAPLVISATLAVTPADAGARLKATVTITSDVPFFGSLVERAAESHVRAAIAERIDALAGS